MPLAERHKLENEAVLQFEEALKDCNTYKDDFVSDLCDELSIIQRQAPTQDQIYRKLIQQGLNKKQAEDMT
jgi:energy-converting hydrogenase A subunit M